MRLKGIKQVIVTGGAGFIAKYVIQELNREGVTNIVLFERYDRLELENFRNLQGLTFSSLESHLNLEEYLEDKKEEIGCIIHLGANASTTGFDAEEYLWNNYECSKMLLDFSVAQGIRFIYASSASIYGDGSKGFNDENFIFKQLKPLNYYAYSKWLFDQYVIDNQLEDKVLGLRFFNVFGADRSKKEMRCIVTRAYEMIVEHKKMELFSVKAERDFVFARDAARFIVESILKKSTGIVNFGMGIAHSFQQMCDETFHALGLKPHYEWIPLPEYLQGKYQYHTLSDSGKFRTMLLDYDYEFQFTPLKEAIRQTIEELKG